jgi:hypothetical protein
MDELTYILAPCGIDCGECSIHLRIPFEYSHHLADIQI